MKSPTRLEKGFSSARSDNSKKSQKFNKNGMSNLLKRPSKKIAETSSCRSAKVKVESGSLSPVKVLKLDLAPLLRSKDAEQEATTPQAQTDPQFAFRLVPTE